jgi:hypothetical protein
MGLENLKRYLFLCKVTLAAKSELYPQLSARFRSGSASSSRLVSERPFYERNNSDLPLRIGLSILSGKVVFDLIKAGV